MSIPTNLFPEPARLPEPYMNPRQAQKRAPTSYENELGDALEAAFAEGIWELEGLVSRLNEDGVRTPEGREWTVERFRAVIERLGA